MRYAKNQERADYGKLLTQVRDEIRYQSDGRFISSSEWIESDLQLSNNQKVLGEQKTDIEEIVFTLDHGHSDYVLKNVKDQLLNSALMSEGDSMAFDFISTMVQLRNFNIYDILLSVGWRYGKHVLVQNQFLKLVLIVWYPGEYIRIHGHPEAGCVFTVLDGTLHEKRYTSKNAQAEINSSVYHKGSIAYIDDRLGFHDIQNPGTKMAVSLHAYIPDLNQ